MVKKRILFRVTLLMLFTVPSTVSSSVMINPSLIDQFRITVEEIGTIGHWSVAGYMIREPAAMVLTRVALGEAPNCLPDQIYIMWNIKMRAELGFKNYNTGPHSYKIDRWGPPNSIHEEALCVRGCQYDVVRVANNVWVPRSTGFVALRLMLYPDDDQLMQFYLAYQNANRILDTPLEQMPTELIGYDGFLAAGSSGKGWPDWKLAGLDRVQLTSCGNVWNDKYKEDNRWFALHINPVDGVANDEQKDYRK